MGFASELVNTSMAAKPGWHTRSLENQVWDAHLVTQTQVQCSEMLPGTQRHWFWHEQVTTTNLSAHLGRYSTMQVRRGHKLRSCASNDLVNETSIYKPLIRIGLGMLCFADALIACFLEPHSPSLFPRYCFLGSKHAVGLVFGALFIIYKE